MNVISLSRNQGNSYWVLGDLYVFKLTGKDTKGSMIVMDQVIQPQSGPPPHIHHREDETFYILEGRFSFMYNDAMEEFEAGSLIYIPKGSLHTFKNIGDKAGRLLVTVTPAGLEDFFYAIGTPAVDDTPPPFDPTIIDKILSLSREYHMEVRLPG